MFSVLLVDDNFLATEHLKNEINWYAYGFTKVSVAYDGEEALKLYKNYRHDLILTDISMPGMDGMELAKNIKSIDPNVLVVFISSYEEFSYARSALKIGVYDYILKHEFIGESLQKKIKEYRQIVEANRIQTRKSRKENLLALLKEEKESGLYDKYFTSSYDLILVEQRHYLPVLSERFGIYNQELRAESFESFCCDFSEDIFTVTKVDKYIYALLLISSNAKDRNKFIYKLKNELNNTFEDVFSIFWICQGKKIKQCKEQYEELKGIVSERYFLGESIVWSFIYKKTDSEPADCPVLDIESTLDKYNSDEINQYIDETYFQTILNKNYSHFSFLTQELVGYMKKYDGKLVDMESGKSFKLINNMSELQWYNASDIVFWIKQKFNELLEIRNSNSLFNYSDDVQSALQYIFDNYHNADLSIEQIAMSTSLGVNRLNVLFRKETNQTIGRFLTNYRLKKAKEYLLNNYKITAVYKLVGYSTPQYFTTVFRNEFGITPYEFRKEQRNDK